MPDKPIRIGIVAAESSADQLGETVVKVLQTLSPGCHIEGIAGPKMQALGVKPLFEASDISVMGLTEVLGSLFKILKIRKHLIQYFVDNPPDLFIGIDAPDFNLTVEEKLRACGIPTIHYVSPSVWAWKAWRIHKIKRATDAVLCLFPFEVDFYKKHNHPAYFVGHPLADKIPLKKEKDSARRCLNLDSNEKVLALLPGSRAHELKCLLPIFLETIQVCKARYPNLKVILPLAHPSLSSVLKKFQSALQPLDITVLDGRAHTVLAAADLALMASGTVTLEAMLTKTPMVVAYKLSLLSFWVARLLVKVRVFSLPNIISGQKVVPEFIQNDVNAKNLSQALITLLEDSTVYHQQITVFNKTHSTMIADTETRIQQILKRFLNY